MTRMGEPYYLVTVEVDAKVKLSFSVDAQDELNARRVAAYIVERQGTIEIEDDLNDGLLIADMDWTSSIPEVTECDLVGQEEVDDIMGQVHLDILSPTDDSGDAPPDAPPDKRTGDDGYGY